MAADHDDTYFKYNPMYLFVNRVHPKNGNTPLMSACEKGHLNVIIPVVCFGADLDLRNKNGETAMDIAVKNNYQNIVTFLTEIRSELPCLKHLISSKKFDDFFQKLKEIEEKYGISELE